MIKTEWDYSDRAKTYDYRADYSFDAIREACSKMNLHAGSMVADVGAGTGKLTKELLELGFSVSAVEPNDQMRLLGVQNTISHEAMVSWYEGTGEDTGLPSSSFDAVFFGSSFNVVDSQLALKESARILRPKGFFCCMWNHRDVTDPVQARVERAIREAIPSFDPGSRRQDPSEEILGSGLFTHVLPFEGQFLHASSKNETLEAWRSHDTLFRQSGNDFESVIQAISGTLPEGSFSVPYTTRIWVAKSIN